MARPHNARKNPITHLTLKHRLRKLLDQGHLEHIAQMAVHRKRVLGSLISLTYDADPRIGWRAVEAVGAAAARIADADPDHVREHLRRLLWLMSEESGGICWRAPEAMAEIVRHRPNIFADYVPIVVSLIVSLEEEDLVHFRPGILRAIGQLAAVAGDHLQAALPAVTSALDDADPQVRGMAVWCLTKVGRAELLRDRPELLSDEGPVEVYENGRLNGTTVSQLAQRGTSSAPAQT
jgi:HEAT repeat protein